MKVLRFHGYGIPIVTEYLILRKKIIFRESHKERGREREMERTWRKWEVKKYTTAMRNTCNSVSTVIQTIFIFGNKDYENLMQNNFSAHSN